MIRQGAQNIFFSIFEEEEEPPVFFLLLCVMRIFRDE
jgi:hypothetical protein